jgi:hypothetical protein
MEGGREGERERERESEKRRGPALYQRVEKGREEWNE